VTLRDQVVQECLDIILIELLGMSLVVKEDELSEPVDVAGGCARAVVASEAGEPDLLEEYWLLAVKDVRSTRYRISMEKCDRMGFKGTSNNPWISILNDTIRHLCVEDLRNSLLLRAIFALI